MKILIYCHNIFRLQNQAKRLGKVLKDTRFDPLDTAIWWTEYLIRQDNTGHLISPLQDQNWVQRRQLDIWRLVFLLSLIVIYVIFKTIRWMAFSFWNHYRMD